MAVGVNGILGTTLAAIGKRCGAKVIRIAGPGGRAIDPEDPRQGSGRSGPMPLVAIVRAETSIGAWQPLDRIGQLRRYGDTLFVVDAVTSLGSGLGAVWGKVWRLRVMGESAQASSVQRLVNGVSSLMQRREAAAATEAPAAGTAVYLRGGHTQQES